MRLAWDTEEVPGHPGLEPNVASKKLKKERKLRYIGMLIFNLKNFSSINEVIRLLQCCVQGYRLIK